MPPRVVSDQTPWTHYSASRQFFKVPRQFGHDGPSHEHIVVDGVVVATLSRHRQQFLMALIKHLAEARSIVAQLLHMVTTFFTHCLPMLHACRSQRLSMGLLYIRERQSSDAQYVDLLGKLAELVFLSGSPSVGHGWRYAWSSVTNSISSITMVFSSCWVSQASGLRF